MFTNVLALSMPLQNTSRTSLLCITMSAVISLSSVHLPSPPTFLSSNFLATLSPNYGHVGHGAHSSSPQAGVHGPNANVVQKSIEDRLSKTYRTWHAKTYSKLVIVGDRT